MQRNVYLYILGMWLVSYLIRVLPLTLIRRQITNRTIRSFLYYVPYVTLAVMTLNTKKNEFSFGISLDLHYLCSIKQSY